MESVKVDQGTVKSAPMLGLCMEAAGIKDGDTIVYDTSKRPMQVGDIVVVKMKQLFNRETEEVRSYYGCYEGAHWVKTCYSGTATDSFTCIPVDDFIGMASIIIAPEGIVKWEKDINNYPDRLSEEQTLDKEPSNCSSLPPHNELIKTEGNRIDNSICSEMETLGFRLKGLANMAAMINGTFDGVTSMDSYGDAFDLFAHLMVEFNGKYEDMLGRLMEEGALA